MNRSLAAQQSFCGPALECERLGCELMLGKCVCPLLWVKLWAAKQCQLVSQPYAVLCPCRSLALGQQYSSLGSQPILCGSIPGLVPKQLRFCRNYIEIMPSVAEGVKLGIQECQHQFRGRRWNCTTIDDSLAIFGPVLDKGNQQSWGAVDK